MLLAHGTTELSANKIESDGYFNCDTYFFKLLPDIKLGISGSAGFALRGHPQTDKYIDYYCNQDLFMLPFKKELKKAADKYVEKRKKDTTPGLVYIIDAPESFLEYHTGLRSFFVPNECFSTEKISTSTITKIMCLYEDAEFFSNKYGHPVEMLDEIKNDPLLIRLYFTINNRFQRLIKGTK